MACPAAGCKYGPYVIEASLRRHVCRTHPELVASLNKQRAAKVLSDKFKAKKRLLRQLALNAKEAQRSTVYAIDTETVHLGRHEIAECV